MNANILKIGAAAAVAYLFRDTLIAEYHTLTGTTAAAAAGTQTPADTAAADAAAKAADADAAAKAAAAVAAATQTQAAQTAAAVAAAVAAQAKVDAQAAADLAAASNAYTPPRNGHTTTPPATGGVRDRLQATASAAGYTGSAPLNLDQWTYYYNQSIGTISPAQNDQIVIALGNRSVKISVDAYIAGGKTAGVFPSGLSGLPSFLPITSDLIRRAAASTQTAAILGTKIYLPFAAWAQLRARATGQTTRADDPGRSITANEFHTLRSRPRRAA